MTTFCPTMQSLPELRAGEKLRAKDFATVRRRTVLEGCKWDPQVGDEETLADFPLILKAGTWKRLALLAEQLAHEAVEAEEEIRHKPALLHKLGLPSVLERLLAKNATPSPGRVMRFDFHPTTDGWRISEVNSDVPGGFTEGTHFTAMMADFFPRLRPAGLPGEIWADALAAAVPTNATVALLSAPAYMEDHQVIAFLAARLRERGCKPHLAKPEQLSWRDGWAHLKATWHQGPIDAIVRFYQAEWLSRLPAGTGWPLLLGEGETPVTNPACAMITESKRFPLVWDHLASPLPAWRALLPETRDPREVAWWRDDGWLLKTALCNTGDTVSMRELMRSSHWIRTRIDARLRPGYWIAQRRFESQPVATPAGPRHVCLGIYTVNGKAAGAYARLSEKPLIDFSSTDVALLLEDDD